MRDAVIIHGKPTEERYNWALKGLELMPHEANWLPWLAEQLEEVGVNTQTPVLPQPFAPDYVTWRQAFEAVSGTGPETALIGHSAGAEFILRYLSENPNTHAERIVLVAPYHDFTRKYGDFSEYALDLAIADRVGSIAVLYSTDDDMQIIDNVERLRTLLPDTRFAKRHGFGHFRIGHNMLYPDLPEVLDEIFAPEHNELIEIIRDSPKAIEYEYAKNNGNNWAACFGTRVFIIETWHTFIPSMANNKLYEERIEDTKLRLQMLHDVYPEPSDTVPEDVKADMLRRLDILAFDYPTLTSDAG